MIDHPRRPMVVTGSEKDRVHLDHATARLPQRHEGARSRESVAATGMTGGTATTDMTTETATATDLEVSLVENGETTVHATLGGEDEIRYVPVRSVAGRNTDGILHLAVSTLIHAYVLRPVLTDTRRDLRK